MSAAVAVSVTAARETIVFAFTTVAAVVSCDADAVRFAVPDTTSAIVKASRGATAILSQNLLTKLFVSGATAKWFLGSSTEPEALVGLSCASTEKVAGSATPTLSTLETGRVFAAGDVVTKGNTVDFLHPVVASARNLDDGPAVFLLTDVLGLVCFINRMALCLIRSCSRINIPLSLVMCVTYSNGEHSTKALFASRTS